MDNDKPLPWARIPIRGPSTEEEKIGADLFGRPKYVWVAIYDYATIDAEATERDGRNRYKDVPYFASREEGERDFISRPITDADKQQHRSYWEWWLKQKEANKATASVELLPGITPAAVREFEDLGIKTVEALAAFDGDLFERAPLRELAKRFASLSKPRLRLVDGKLEQVA